LDCIPNLEERLKQSIEVVLSYLKDTLELTFCSDEECPELKEFKEVYIIGEQVKLLKLYAFGMEKAYKVRLRALDLLHIVYDHALSGKGYPSEFATLDADFRRKANIIEQEFGVKILT